MVDSKKCVPSWGVWGGLPAPVLTQPIERLLNHALPSGPIAVACSGGPDSAALAVAMAFLCKAWHRPLFLFHVHHGMQNQADQWSLDVEQLGEILSATVQIAHVHVDLTSGQGPEGSARAARQQALQGLAQLHGVGGIVLAHHAQDQAETVLLRLLRGSGVAGLAGMQTATKYGQQAVLWLRPWLDVAKPDVHALVQIFTQATGWQPVLDPSNVDTRLGRGALRRHIIPALDARWPAWVSNVSRHAQQAAQASVLLDEYADMLLKQVGFDQVGHSFDLKIWRELSSSQHVLVFRRWLHLAGASMPTTARLDEIIKQLKGLHALGQDRDLRWEHDVFVVQCQNKRVILSSR
jgi:tRNA(Ile)-lysidine synthase